MEERTFLELYCEQHQIPQSEFVSHVFWRCIPWYAKPIALVMRILYPSFFDNDLQAIRNAGDARDAHQINTEVGHFYLSSNVKGSVLRGLLHVRISGRKITRLGRRSLYQRQ